MPFRNRGQHCSPCTDSTVSSCGTTPAEGNRWQGACNDAWGPGRVVAVDGQSQPAYDQMVKQNFQYTQDNYADAVKAAAREGKPLVAVYGSWEQNNTKRFIEQTLPAAKRGAGKDAIYVYVDPTKCTDQNLAREANGFLAGNHHNSMTVVYSLKPGPDGTPVPERSNFQWLGGHQSYLPSFEAAVREAKGKTESFKGRFAADPADKPVGPVGPQPEPPDGKPPKADVIPNPRPGNDLPIKGPVGPKFEPPKDPSADTPPGPVPIKRPDVAPVAPPPRPLELPLRPPGTPPGSDVPPPVVNPAPPPPVPLTGPLLSPAEQDIARRLEALKRGRQASNEVTNTNLQQDLDKNLAALRAPVPPPPAEAVPTDGDWSKYLYPAGGAAALLLLGRYLYKRNSGGDKPAGDTPVVPVPPVDPKPDESAKAPPKPEELPTPVADPEAAAKLAAKVAAEKELADKLTAEKAKVAPSGVPDLKQETTVGGEKFVVAGYGDGGVVLRNKDAGDVKDGTLQKYVAENFTEIAVEGESARCFRRNGTNKVYRERKLDRDLTATTGETRLVLAKDLEMSMPNSKKYKQLESEAKVAAAAAPATDAKSGPGQTVKELNAEQSFKDLAAELHPGDATDPVNAAVKQKFIDLRMQQEIAARTVQNDLAAKLNSPDRLSVDADVIRNKEGYGAKFDAEANEFIKSGGKSRPGINFNAPGDGNNPAKDVPTVAPKPAQDVLAGVDKILLNEDVVGRFNTEIEGLMPELKNEREDAGSRVKNAMVEFFKAQGMKDIALAGDHINVVFDKQASGTDAKVDYFTDGGTTPLTRKGTDFFNANSQKVAPEAVTTRISVPAKMLDGSPRALSRALYAACMEQSSPGDHSAADRTAMAEFVGKTIAKQAPAEVAGAGKAEGAGLNNAELPKPSEVPVQLVVDKQGVRVAGATESISFVEVWKSEVENLKKALDDEEKMQGEQRNEKKIADLKTRVETEQKAYDALSNPQHPEHKAYMARAEEKVREFKVRESEIADHEAKGGGGGRGKLVVITALLGFWLSQQEK